MRLITVRIVFFITASQALSAVAQTGDTPFTGRPSSSVPSSSSVPTSSQPGGSTAPYTRPNDGSSTPRFQIPPRADTRPAPTSQPFHRPNAPAPQRPASIIAPFGQLTEHETLIRDRVLTYWEFATKKIERYQCGFQLWRYDPVFGPKDPMTPMEYSEGVIKYEAPDRGLYMVESTKVYRRPQAPTEQASWPKLPHPGDHWVCDGENLFEFDHKNKVMVKRPLPPNVRGVNIVNGPLPFLLKAKAAQIQSRFWVRVLPNRKELQEPEYRLEAFPKTRADSANFLKLHIILNKAYVPKALVIFSPGFRPDKPSRTTYNFSDIKINPAAPWFGRQFIVAQAPSGWKEVEEAIPHGQPQNEVGGVAPRRDVIPQTGSPRPETGQPGSPTFRSPTQFEQRPQQFGQRPHTPYVQPDANPGYSPQGSAPRVGGRPESGRYR